jgi:hypothetical protein
MPLAYCSSCDSYYPESYGECRWCGTKPEPPPMGPRIWRGVSAGAFVAMLAAAFVLRNTDREASPPVVVKAIADSAAGQVSIDTVPPAKPVTAIDSGASQLSLALADSGLRDSTSTPAVDRDSASVVSTGSLPPIELAKVPTPGTGGPAASASGPGPGPMEPAETMAPKATTVPTLAAKPAAKPTTRPTASTPSRRPARWVRSVSRDWVVVRRGASKTSGIVASIGPNSRVELGESRGSWRRIRAKGLTGWVQPRNSFRVGSR